MTNGSLMKVESIAECSPWRILQYFWPTLTDYWSWKPIFGLFENGRFRQVLLYILYNMDLCLQTYYTFLDGFHPELVIHLVDWKKTLEIVASVDSAVKKRLDRQSFVVCLCS